jgi:hypothetical protein
MPELFLEPLWDFPEGVLCFNHPIAPPRPSPPLSLTSNRRFSIMVTQASPRDDSQLTTAQGNLVQQAGMCCDEGSEASCVEHVDLCRFVDSFELRMHKRKFA